MKAKRDIKGPLIALAILVLVYFFQQYAGKAPSGEGSVELARLFQEQRSGIEVSGSGVVERTLADDMQGSRHQRFVLRVADDLTILISHNIDLAPRVADLAAGDVVEFSGVYEWNERGGVIHWTHHDPNGRREGGWLRHRGKTFR